jgi:P-type E1-E2 ATPase
MGGANNICSDKTGTLTKNQMTVTRLWAEGKVIDKFEKDDKNLSENLKEILGWAVALNSDAQPRVRSAGF